MEWVKTIATILLFTIIIIAVFNVLNKYVLKKIKINKWIVLSLAIVMFLAPYFFTRYIKSSIIMLFLQGIFVIFLLWFMDLSGFMKKQQKTNISGSSYGKKKKNDRNDVIKPKAKPNRAKSNK
jgi:hypothetical protein